MKIYLLRHQAAGVLWEFPFRSKPTDSQLAAAQSRCAHLHGSHHAKTKEPLWLRVIEC